MSRPLWCQTVRLVQYPLGLLAFLGYMSYLSIAQLKDEPLIVKCAIVTFIFLSIVTPLFLTGRLDFLFMQ